MTLLELSAAIFVGTIPAIITLALQSIENRRQKRREIYVGFLITAYQELEKALNRDSSDQVRNALEKSVAAIQLFGSKKLVDFSIKVAKDIVKEGNAEVSTLLLLMRQELRKELGLEKVSLPIVHLRFRGYN